MNAEKDQLITLAHSMEVSYSALDAEAGLSYDTTVRVSVQPNRYYPDYVAVTLLWLEPYLPRHRGIQPVP